MPWPLQSAYGADGKAYERFQSELAHTPPAPRRTLAGAPAPLHALDPLLEKAQALTGLGARMVVVERPGDASAVVRIHSRAPEEPHTIVHTSSDASFDGVSGQVLQVRRPEPHAPFSTGQIHQAIEALHVASFGGWTIRWLYFFSGCLGTAMMATGTLLFMVKRRRKSAMEFGAATARFYRAVEALNVVAFAGIALASIGYLWANRLLPAGLPGREAWEVRGFLGAWALSLAHAAMRPVLRAWIEQLGLASVLCLGLPLLNQVTTGQHLVAYAAAGDWQRAGVELASIGLGAILACMAVHVRQGRPQRSPASLQGV
jgi:uncharacterized iron-regulated membrane protein